MNPPKRSGIESSFSMGGSNGECPSDNAEPQHSTHLYRDRIQDLPEVIARDLNNYGLCVLDDFLGEGRAQKVLGEVFSMHSEGKFTDGKLVNPLPGDVRDQRQIRGDKIAWIGGQEPGCANIAYLINQVGKHDCESA